METSNPEITLLRYTSRARPTASRHDEIRRLAAMPVDWGALVHMALAQRVYLAVYANLSTACPQAIPSDVRGVLGLQALHRAELGAALAEELTRLLRLLHAHDIRTLPFKGPTLAQIAYGRLDRRVYHDLDLLIEPGRFEETERLLRACGYLPQYDFGEGRKALFLRLESGMPFRHEAQSFALDLHLCIGPQRYSFAPGFDALWARSQRVSLGGTAVRTPGMEDLLQIVCWHGAKHRWLILKFVGDVAELIEAAPALDWDAVRGQARRLHTERMLYLGLWLAHDVLGTTLPPEVMHAIRRDPQVERLAAQLAPGLFAGRIEQACYVRRHAFQWQMRGTPASKLRYACSTLAFNKLSRRLLLGPLTSARGRQAAENTTPRMPLLLLKQQAS